MPALEKWLKLFGSPNTEIRRRATIALVEREDTPLPVLFQIFDERGGRKIVERLCRSPEREFVRARIRERLESPTPFHRELACEVLGHQGDPRDTARLLECIDDTQLMVRRAAGFALAKLGDRSALPELHRQLRARSGDDINVRFALKCAIKTLSA